MLWTEVKQSSRTINWKKKGGGGRGEHVNILEQKQCLVLQLTSSSLSLWILGVKWSLSTSHANGGCQSWKRKKKCFINRPGKQMKLLHSPFKSQVSLKHGEVFVFPSPPPQHHRIQHCPLGPQLSAVQPLLAAISSLRLHEADPFPKRTIMNKASQRNMQHQPQPASLSSISICHCAFQVDRHWNGERNDILKWKTCPQRALSPPPAHTRRQGPGCLPQHCKGPTPKWEPWEAEGFVNLTEEHCLLASQTSPGLQMGVTNTQL